jgi:hypothetical protein
MNAHAKDALEDKLHEEVCSGGLAGDRPALDRNELDRGVQASLPSQFSGVRATGSPPAVELILAKRLHRIIGTAPLIT